jgi:uncharacterized protein
MKAVGGRHICLLMLAALVAACSCGRSKTGADATPVARAAAAGEIRVEVTQVGYDQDSQAHYVLLRAENRDRVLPIMIGDEEAQAITLELHGIKPERPLTHDLLRSVIERTGNQVDRVVISDMRDEVYYAKIYMDQGRYAIDSRPSDAIALAMGTGAPIFVADKLLQSSLSGDVAEQGALPPTARALGITVQDLTPDLARYFGVPGRKGVLVAEVADPAQRAGIERGDIITDIGGKLVNALADFSQDLSAVRNGAVTLTLMRAGAAHTITVSR